MTAMMMSFMLMCCLMGAIDRIEGRKLDDAKHVVLFLIPVWISVGVTCGLLILRDPDNSVQTGICTVVALFLSILVAMSVPSL